MRENEPEELRASISREFRPVELALNHEFYRNVLTDALFFGFFMLFFHLFLQSAEDEAWRILPFSPLIFLVVLAFIILSASRTSNRKKREELAEITRRRTEEFTIELVNRNFKLQYHPETPFRIAQKYRHLNIINHTFNLSPPGAEIKDFFNGIYLDHSILFFNIVSPGKIRLRAAIIHLASWFPELKAWPAASREALGLEIQKKIPEVDFDSIAFSQAFNCKCRDKKFAYDIFHPRMMEHFLEKGNIYFEIEKDTLMILFPEGIVLKELKKQLDELVEIKELLPGYLFES